MTLDRDLANDRAIIAASRTLSDARRMVAHARFGEYVRVYGPTHGGAYGCTATSGNCGCEEDWDAITGEVS